MRKKNKQGEQEEKKTITQHDEAFKKLLQTFFAEFIALFFPELDKLLDHTHTRLLMQELLVDIVGQESRSLDLIIEFRFFKVELRRQNWREFITSDNPIAAALLAKMGYNKTEEREVRAAYLRMILRIRKKLDDAKLALIMSVADLYFEPNDAQDFA
ncbi:hypothetical protein [Cohnella soli]|uniref:Transposase n=1 Tax=Cohnella soli TaxID=425005 RepID=A0ABW0HY80_9BACL